MTVYVDEVRRWANKGFFARGSCHMTADTLDELHAFALRIGLRRTWFQPHAISPHYDLTVGRRAAAVRAGAVEMSFRELKERGLGRTKKFGGSLPDLAEQEKL